MAIESSMRHLWIVQSKSGYSMTPTTETYTELQQAYDWFNAHLFDNQLPGCLITLQRVKKTFGYFSPKRFSNHAGDITDEIAMNPTCFARAPLVEIMQTLVHEMVHQWQHHFGNPGRARYHNREWGNKMESIGLMPSSTGKPGGKKTGERMSDYAIKGGRFLAVCERLITQAYKISWYDRFTNPANEGSEQENYALSQDLPEEVLTIAANEGVEMASIEEITENSYNKSNRSKYTCPCEINVWGRPGLHIRCGSCDEAFEEQP